MCTLLCNSWYAIQPTHGIVVMVMIPNPQGRNGALLKTNLGKRCCGLQEEGNEKRSVEKKNRIRICFFFMFSCFVYCLFIFFKKKFDSR